MRNTNRNRNVPDNLVETMTEQDPADLTAYLATLGDAARPVATITLTHPRCSVRTRAAQSTALCRTHSLAPKMPES